MLFNTITSDGIIKELELNDIPAYALSELSKEADYLDIFNVSKEQMSEFRQLYKEDKVLGYKFINTEGSSWSAPSYFHIPSRNDATIHIVESDDSIRICKVQISEVIKLMGENNIMLNEHVDDLSGLRGIPVYDKLLVQLSDASK